MKSSYVPSYILGNMVRESLPGRRKRPDYEGGIN
jgi:hypothetical protein